MKKPMPFSDKRWACPHCNYSVAPEMERTVKKHFDAHSLQCVRCLYRTETKATWAEAEAAYRTSQLPQAQSEHPVSGQLKSADPPISSTKSAIPKSVS